MKPPAILSGGFFHFRNDAPPRNEFALMPLTAISIEGYRSIRKLRFPIGSLTAFVGKNGTGKTNLYRAVELLHFAACGTITRKIAEEGGVQSALWAGKRQKNKLTRLILEAELGDYSYRIEIGLPAPMQAALELEPLVKFEELILHAGGKKVSLMKREKLTAWARDENGKRQIYDDDLLPSETALANLKDAAHYPEIDEVRRLLLDWRFYHAFRTDRESPVRQPCLALTTPTLSSDAKDLASVLATLYEIRGEAPELDEAIDDAFPGAKLITNTENGRCSFQMEFAETDGGPSRPFSPHELSDGTLAYLCLLGALLSYRRPKFIALNEPEVSLHPDLMPPLARLIAKASERSQIWVVTHSETLAVCLSEETLIVPRTVIKEEGATWLKGLNLIGEFPREEQ